MEGLRGGPSGGVYQLAEKPNGVFATGFIILANLDMSDRLKVSFLFASKSELTTLRLYEGYMKQLSVPLAGGAGFCSNVPDDWHYPIHAWESRPEDNQEEDRKSWRLWRLSSYGW